MKSLRYVGNGGLLIVGTGWREMWQVVATCD